MNPEPQSSPAKRIAALVITMALASLGIVIYFRKDADPRVLYLLAAAVCLGIIYTIMGKLPDWLHAMLGPKITRDDDLRNLNAKIFLPIILLAVAIAALLIWRTISQH